MPADAPVLHDTSDICRHGDDHVKGLVYTCTVYPKKYAHGFVVLCFVVVMQSFIMNSHEVFIHIHQGCFAGTGAIVRLPQCQWSKPDGYGKISQCITTAKHSKEKPCAYFLGYTVRGKRWRLTYPPKWLYNNRIVLYISIAYRSLNFLLISFRQKSRGFLSMYC